MVLRCSLLGHDYGETEVEREREERGSEVVVTVEEYEECSRCGERNVISENTEVTSISAKTGTDSLPDEFELESDTPATGTDTEIPPEAVAEDGTEVAFDEGDADAEFIDADAAASADDDDFEIPTDEDGEPITDDGEILEDDEPAPDRDRGHGEWPDSDDVGPPVGAENEPTEWPDEDVHPADADSDTDIAASGAEFVDDEFEDSIDDADEPITDDAIVLENDTGESGESAAAADARSVTTTTSDAVEARDTGDAGDSATQTGTASENDIGFERAGSAPAPGQSGGTGRTDVPTEFYCPRCEFDSSGDRGSLRTGDICPECRKGYLGERELR